MGVRPEHLAIGKEGEGQCDGRVDVVEYLGADTFVVLDCGPLGHLSVRTHGDSDLQVGAVAGLVFDPDRLVFFDDAGDAVT